MKRLLFLFLGSSLVCSVGLSQSYHPNDVEKLRNFLNEKAEVHDYVNDETFTCTNAQIIKGKNYNPTWTGTAWVQEFDGLFEWSNAAERRIIRIAFDYLPAIGWGVSGNFDFSGCTELGEVFCSGEQLTAVNFENCTNLTEANLELNLIKSANFNNCMSLETVNIGYNQLLPSRIMIDLTNRPAAFHFDFHMQNVYNEQSYTAIWDNEEEEIYLAIDLNAEMSAASKFDLIFNWNTYGIEPKEKKDGVYYFKLTELQNAQQGVGINCYWDSPNPGSGVSGSVNYTPIGMDFANINITVPRGAALNAASAYFYLMQNDEPFYMGTASNIAGTNGNFIESGLLPEGSYYIGVEAEGYFFTYYYESQNPQSPVPVLSWKGASIVEVFSTNDFHEHPVYLTPKNSPSPTGTITISGKLLFESADQSLLKASVLPMQKATVVLESSSGSKADNLILIDTTEPNQEDGTYTFSRLEGGKTYYVSVDLAGYEMGNPIIVEASSSDGSYDDNNFVINETNKTVAAQLILSAPSMEAGRQLTVYPNPATQNEVRIEGLEGAYIVKTIDMSGRVVMSVTGSSPELTLHFGDLPSGMYLIRIESQSQTYIKKIIKL